VAAVEDLLIQGKQELLLVFQVAEYVYLQSVVAVEVQITLQGAMADPEVAEVTAPVFVSLVVVQPIKELKELEVQNPVEAAELLQEQIT
jgi:hypothetical protein